MLGGTNNPMRLPGAVKIECPRPDLVILVIQMEPTTTPVHKLQAMPWETPPINPVIRTTTLEAPEYHR